MDGEMTTSTQTTETAATTSAGTSTGAAGQAAGAGGLGNLKQLFRIFRHGANLLKKSACFVQGWTGYTAIIRDAAPLSRPCAAQGSGGTIP